MNKSYSQPVASRLYFSLQILFISTLLIVSGLFFTSCGDDDEGPKRVVLVDAQLTLTRTSSELKTFIENSSLDLDNSALKYDVDLYKVKYKTMYKGTQITASGLVILPKTADELPMVSFQHGTIVTQTAAPTGLPLNSTELILYAALSSSGFITVVPDFIGFGESSVYFHPYYVEEATASAIIDNLKAARELALEKSLKYNDRLFLAGYSQGGYATMATHKSLEETPVDHFNLIASFPAAGGYDVKGVQEYFFSQSTYSQPYYMPYVALAYKSYYGWNESLLPQFFQEPYASRIPTLFNGTNTSSAINAALTTDVSAFIQEDLRLHIDEKDEYAFLVTAFEDNSLLNWTPKIKMFMYHGDADVTVPYQNSVDTYQHFLDNGASSNTVQFFTIEGADHGTGVLPYIEDMIGKLLVLK